MGTILLILLVLMILGTLPAYPHSRNWGYAPSGVGTVLLIVLLVLLFTSTVPWGFTPVTTNTLP